MTNTASPGVLVLCLSLPAVWWGAIVAISFIETPLKFRAPGITVPLGVGIGRLVFKALNLLEIGLAATVLAGVAAAPDPGSAAWAITAVLLLTLLAQVSVVRPLLDRRATALLAGEDSGASRLHLVYVGGEVVKFLALPSLAILLAVRLG